MSSGNYYDSIYEGQAYSVEQAILAEDLSFTKIENIDGKFFVKVLTPIVASNDINTKSKAGLTSTNYITINIPAYILLQFANISTQIIKVPLKMDPETGLPTKYKNYNVLTYSFNGSSDSDDDSATTTKKSTVKKSTKKTTTTTTSSSAFTIPKGTIFFISFLSGQTKADKAFIIGVSPYKYEQ